MTGIEAAARVLEREGLPASVHTEQVILGAMQDNPTGLAEGLELCDERCFSLHSHRRIFATYRRLSDAGIAVNLTTVIVEMERTHDLVDIGGRSYLMGLLENSHRFGALADFARILRKKAAQRETLLLLVSVGDRVMDGETDPEELLAELTERAYQIESGTQRTTYRPLSESVPATVADMIHQRDRGSGLLGITTGLSTLDEFTTGYRDGELTYVGALPGRGKTSVMLQGMFAAARAGVRTGIISLEMRANQLIKRLTVMASDLEAWKMRDAKKMNTNDFALALREAENLAHLPVFCCDVDGLRASDITSMARRMVRNDGVRILFVDFVQIVQSVGRTQKEAIDQVSAALRSIAKILNIPVVVGSQLARRDADVNRVPTLQDLRESGNLEQDAHNVLLLYRPVDRETSEFTGKDQIIVAKSREGATGALPVVYDTRSLTYQPRVEKRV